MPTKTKLQRACEALGMYYGVANRSNYLTFLETKERYTRQLTILATNDQNDEASARKQAAAVTLTGYRHILAAAQMSSPLLILDAFMDLTSGGRTTYEVLADVSANLQPEGKVATQAHAESRTAQNQMIAAKDRVVVITGGGVCKDFYRGAGVGLVNAVERQQGYNEKLFRSGRLIGVSANFEGTTEFAFKAAKITASEKFWYLPTMDAILRGTSDSDDKIPKWISHMAGAARRPTKLNPHLAMIQITQVSMNYCNRDSGAVSLFMNAIPTIEMSRCVPYLDITLITPRAAFRGTPGTDATLSSMSLPKILMGRARIDPPTDSSLGPRLVADYAMAAGIPINLLGDKGFPNLMSLIVQQADDGKLGMSSSGMELFCSPQTLTNADETYNEHVDAMVHSVPQEAATGGQTGAAAAPEPSVAYSSRRDAPIIDKFRPFASVESFTVSVNPGAGLQSYKTAELELRLHDRSRLSEIADFIRPAQYETTEMYIEYGWSHPDGNPLSGNDNNVFGTFLDCMRVKEKWNIKNNTFNFTETGEVKIKLKLVMAGAADIFSVSLMEGEGLDPIMKSMYQLTDAISTARKKLIEETAGVKGISVPEVITAAGSTDGALTLSAKQRTQLQKFIHSNRTSTDPTLTELRELLEELHGKDGKGGVASNINDDILSIIKRKLKRLDANQTLDPFRKHMKGSGKLNKSYREFRTIASRKWCSLGKIILLFMGVPMTSTHKFDEVQIMAYPFNKFASYARNHNIAQFPILISEFKTQFNEKIKANPQITVGEFGQWLINTFVNTHTAKAYGLSTFYTMKEGSDTVTKTYKNMTKLGEATAQVLSDAYGIDVKPGAEKAQFKLPSIKITYECVGGAPTVDTTTLFEQNLPTMFDTERTTTLKGKNQASIAEQITASASDITILRIHIYDEQASSYECASQLLDGARDDAMGALTLPAGIPTPEEMKALQTGNNLVTGRKSTHRPPSIQEALSPNHWRPFRDGLSFLMQAGVIEPLPRELAGTTEKMLENLDKLHWRVKGGFSGIKRWIMETTPSIVYGSQMSAITSAQLSSLNDAEHASIQILTQGENSSSTPEGHADKGIPMTLFPIELSIDTFGCPLFNFAQKFFIDFGTGTSADNIYYVVGLDHTLTPGGFKSKIKLKQENALGKYVSMMDRLEEGIASFHEMTKLKEFAIREVTEQQLAEESRTRASKAKAVRRADVKQARTRIRALQTRLKMEDDGLQKAQAKAMKERVDGTIITDANRSIIKEWLDKIDKTKKEIEDMRKYAQ